MLYRLFELTFCGLRKLQISKSSCLYMSLHKNLPTYNSRPTLLIIVGLGLNHTIPHSRASSSRGGGVVRPKEMAKNEVLPISFPITPLHHIKVCHPKALPKRSIPGDSPARFFSAQVMKAQCIKKKITNNYLISL